MSLDLSSLDRAVAAMARAVQEATREEFLHQLTPAQSEIVQAGLIQTFEVTYELCWKHMKRWLEMNLGPDGIDGVSRKELFRIAAEHKLVTDTARWFEYHAARNETAHTYNPDKANAVAHVARAFLTDAQALLANLKASRD